MRDSAAITDDDFANPVLIEVTRSGARESVHRGSVVLVSADGALTALGAPAPTFPRSSLKPLQAVAMVRAGLDVPPEMLALVGASHEGTPAHVDVARAILRSAGLDESALGCPVSLPESVDAAATVIRHGGYPSRIFHNCSGKHAGMLATCVVNGWPVTGYLNPDHPMQQAVLATVTDLSGDQAQVVGVDGCGAVVPMVSLAGLARAFRRLVTAAAGSAERRVADAMRARPDLVGGPGRDVTELMADTPGLLAKDGAEAVWAAALPDGRAMAAKLDDGALRALPAVLAATLHAWGYVGEGIGRWAHDPILGGGHPVGEIRATEQFEHWLDGAV